jgi:hypothetical protein
MIRRPQARRGPVLELVAEHLAETVDAVERPAGRAHHVVDRVVELARRPYQVVAEARRVAGDARHGLGPDVGVPGGAQYLPRVAGEVSMRVQVAHQDHRIRRRREDPDELERLDLADHGALRL